VGGTGSPGHFRWRSFYRMNICGRRRGILGRGRSVADVQPGLSIAQVFQIRADTSDDEFQIHKVGNGKGVDGKSSTAALITLGCFLLELESMVALWFF